MSEVARFLEMLDLKAVKLIAGGLGISRNRNLSELRDDVERACGQKLEGLVQSHVMMLAEWNDIVDERLSGDRRRSFDEVRAEIRDRLHPINRLRGNTVSSIRDERDSRELASEALGLSEDDVCRLLGEFHGNCLIDSIRDELLARAAQWGSAQVAVPRRGADVMQPPSTLLEERPNSPTQRNGHRASPTRFFHLGGVWSVVEAFLQDLPVGAEIIWVTFSFNASSSLLKLLAARRLRVRVLCRHPRAGVTIYRSAFCAWRNAGVGELYGLKTREGEDEEESPGHLHAKALIARTSNGYRGLIGSFNLAANSLDCNTESITELGQGAAQCWQEAEELLRSPFVESIQEEDCADEDGAVLGRTTLGRDVVVVGGPNEATLPARSGADEAAEPSPTVWNPVGLGYLRTALDEMLSSWPPAGPSRGWQQKMFRRLWRGMGESRAEVLFLPVGVGKTFIALRWLLEHFDRQSLDRGERGLFLAPNEWVARSVARDVSLVVERARLRAQTADDWRSVEAVAKQVFDVRRPSEFDDDLLSSIRAAVADECHNWSDAASNRTGVSYRSVVESIRGTRGRPRLLGLSATPCRMEHGRFDVAHFLRRFRGNSSSDPGAMITLREAIEKELLARFRVKPLLRGAGRKQVEELLHGDEAVVAMGDYHLVVLREVWSVLMAHQRQLLEELTKALAAARRVLVFVPPVGQDADGFVSKLGKLVRAMTGRRDTFFDFRDRAESDQSASEIFEQFRDVDVARGRPAVLVTVNRFSEGVSINDIDTLVFLRATLSPRVAVQALGRGLRLDPSRADKVCTVYDAVCFAERLEHWEAGAAESS